MKITLIILSLITGVVLLFIFGKINQSEKYYSVDNQYSWYTKKNVYSIFEHRISFNDGCESGTVYLYDEIDKKTLYSVNLGCLHMQTESCGFHKSINAFGGYDSELGIYQLPRPIEYKQ